MTKTILRRILTSMIFMAAALLPLNQALAQTPKIRLEGAWDVLVFDDGVPFKLTYTFAPGKTANEGTVVFFTEADLFPDGGCTPTLGAWKRTSANQFISTTRTVCREGDFIFTLVSYDQYDLNDSSRTLTGRQRVFGFDQLGNPLFSDEFLLQGNILEATPAPPLTQFRESGTGKPALSRRSRRPEASLTRPKENDRKAF
jgi:hypothetical protein